MYNDNDTPKRSRFPWAVVLIVLLAVIAGTWHLARNHDRTYRFRFHMPDGYVFYEDVEYKGFSRNTASPDQRYEYSWRRTYSVTRMPTGYSVVVTPSRVRMRHKTPDFAIIRAMMSVKVTYRTDLNGRLTGVSVCRDFLRAVAKAYKSLPSYRSFSAPSAELEEHYEQQVANARRNWNETFGQFVGRSVRVGDRWTTTRPIAFSASATVFPTTRCVVEAFMRDGRSLLRITSRCGPHRDPTRKDYHRRYTRSRGWSAPQVTRYESRTEGEMAVDPDGIRVQSLSVRNTTYLEGQTASGTRRGSDYDTQWQLTSVFHYPRDKRTIPKNH